MSVVTAITDFRSLNLINSNEFEKVSDLYYQISEDYFFVFPSFSFN